MEITCGGTISKAMEIEVSVTKINQINISIYSIDFY